MQIVAEILLIFLLLDARWNSLHYGLLQPYLYKEVKKQIHPSLIVT